MALENQCNFTCPTCRPHALANTLSACQLQRGWEFFYEHLPHLINSLELVVSVDAADEHTYRLNRPGGDWSILMDNLDFASKLPLRSLHLSMVVQQNNYQQMIAFCHMARSLGARAHFSLLRHWNSFSDDEFKLR